MGPFFLVALKLKYELGTRDGKIQRLVIMSAVHFGGIAAFGLISFFLNKTERSWSRSLKGVALAVVWGGLGMLFLLLIMRSVSSLG